MAGLNHERNVTSALKTPEELFRFCKSESNSSPYFLCKIWQQMQNTPIGATTDFDANVNKVVSFFKNIPTRRRHSHLYQKCENVTVPWDEHSGQP